MHKQNYFDGAFVGMQTNDLLYLYEVFIPLWPKLLGSSSRITTGKVRRKWTEMHDITRKVTNSFFVEVYRLNRSTAAEIASRLGN